MAISWWRRGIRGLLEFGVSTACRRLTSKYLIPREYSPSREPIAMAPVALKLVLSVTDPARLISFTAFEQLPAEV